MKNRISIFLLLVLFAFCGLTWGQRHNYVLQNSPSSYGIFIFSGVNMFNTKDLSMAQSKGVKNAFGMTYLINRGFMSIESGLTYAHQRIRYGEELLQDSTDNQFGLKLVSLGVPISLNYKFSQKRKRTYMLLGVNPEFVIKSSLASNSSSPRDPQNKAIFSHSKKVNMMIGGKLGIGRSYDLDASVMLRIELGYQFSALSILERNYQINTLGLRLQIMNHN